MGRTRVENNLAQLPGRVNEINVLKSLTYSKCSSNINKKKLETFCLVFPEFETCRTRAANCWAIHICYLTYFLKQHLTRMTTVSKMNKLSFTRCLCYSAGKQEGQDVNFHSCFFHCTTHPCISLGSLSAGIPATVRIAQFI